MIHPEYVLVTGDLALGYSKKLQSASQTDQWQIYESMWKYQDIVKRENWIDIPGNHDFTTKELFEDSNDISHFTASKWNSRYTVIPISTDDSNQQQLCLVGIDFSYYPRKIFLIFTSDIRFSLLA